MEAKTFGKLNIGDCIYFITNWEEGSIYLYIWKIRDIIMRDQYMVCTLNDGYSMAIPKAYINEGYFQTNRRDKYHCNITSFLKEYKEIIGQLKRRINCDVQCAKVLSPNSFETAYTKVGNLQKFHYEMKKAIYVNDSVKIKQNI